ncbi:MAG: hypothetical protein LBN43_01355, partial [Oscillospiraceae bacterium]|nr:hypothetical protein [Oscillospiraceae bacterium]
MDDMEIKLVHPICCGLDVHKNFVFACIVITKQLGQTPQYIKRRFSTYAGDISRLAEWLKSYNCCDVCMESAGKYWWPVYFPLEASGLAHTKYVKSIKGKLNRSKAVGLAAPKNATGVSPVTKATAYSICQRRHVAAT